MSIAIDEKPKVFTFQLPPWSKSSSNPAKKIGNAIIVVTEGGDIEHYGLEDWELLCEEKEVSKN